MNERLSDEQLDDLIAVLEMTGQKPSFLAALTELRERRSPQGMEPNEGEAQRLKDIRGHVGQSIVREIDTVTFSVRDALWLHERAALSARKPGVPEGWVLVPKEPTREQEDAAIEALGWCDEDVAAAATNDEERTDLRVTYRAMLAASPTLEPRR